MAPSAGLDEDVDAVEALQMAARQHLELRAKEKETLLRRRARCEEEVAELDVEDADPTAVDGLPMTITPARARALSHLGSDIGSSWTSGELAALRSAALSSSLGSVLSPHTEVTEEEDEEEAAAREQRLNRGSADGRPDSAVSTLKSGASQKRSDLASSELVNYSTSTRSGRVRQEDQVAVEPKSDFITTIEVPEWLDVVFAAVGVSYLQYVVQQERERRADEMYVNPWPVVHGMVTSTRFEVTVGAAIVVNCILIGWEASLEEGQLELFFSICEHLFVIFFFGEWCMRMLAFGWIWVFDILNFCDTSLIFTTGIFVKWVLEPMGTDSSSLRTFTVLRALRLARLVKSVRLMPFFKELWVLISGLISSTRPLLWTCVLATTILYVFAVAATELIGRRDVFQDDEYVQERFGNLLRSMFTMFQIMTLDTWGLDVARPTMKKDSRLGVFYVAFVGIGVFIFWNLITAIIVENAFAIDKKDVANEAREMEEQKKRDLKRLADLFLEIDKDGSGDVTEDEFFQAMSKKSVQQMLDAMDFRVSDLEDVWMTLDDGDGVLTIKEFTNGIRRMKGAAKAKDMVDVVKRLRHTTLGHVELLAQVDQFGSELEGLEEDVKRISTDCGEVVGLFQEMFHRLQMHIERNKRRDMVEARVKERARQRAEIKEAQVLVLEEDVDVDDPFMDDD